MNLEDYDNEFCENCGSGDSLLYDSRSGTKLCLRCRKDMKKAYAQKKRDDGEE